MNPGGRTMPRRCGTMGITYVRIGEFAWSRLEPAADRFDFGWLDRAIDVLGAHSLRVVLCTPTATPPKWLVDAHPDILPVGADGRVRGFGSRRHTTFSSPTWWTQSERIVRIIAERYGNHPSVAGWQLDNEWGCHDTTLSYGPEDLRGFHEWLRQRYQDPTGLNAAWGNAFWSMEVMTFAEVALPAGAVTETNPAARLAFHRYASEQVAAYCRMQTEIIRALSPGRFVTHNFNGRFFDYDVWEVAAPLDFASWDSYPIGFAEQFPCTPAERAAFTETGHPDIAAFNHDVHRAAGRGRFWVMEQQPGPVNWAPWNPVPKPGMVRLWTWEALAHGAEVVQPFRWRQAPFAQEQMHAGLHRPDRVRSPGGEEIARVGRELITVGALPPVMPAPVAMVLDYAAAWMIGIQPQGEDFAFYELLQRWYGAVRRLGLDVDFVAPGESLADYALVLAPCLPIVSEAARAAFAAAEGHLVFGPRAGSRTADFRIPDTLAPGALQAQLPIRVTQVASLRPGLTYQVAGAVTGAAERWREWVEGDVEVDARFADGMPALLRAGRASYLACWPDATLLSSVLDYAVRAAGLTAQVLPDGVRVRRRGNLTFAMNYGVSAWQGPEADYLLGSRNVLPQDVACWRE